MAEMTPAMEGLARNGTIWQAFGGFVFAAVFGSRRNALPRKYLWQL